MSMVVLLLVSALGCVMSATVYKSFPWYHPIRFSPWFALFAASMALITGQ